jgi:membrane carboxypeptidase/penicillin-binding protein
MTDIARENGYAIPLSEMNNLSTLHFMQALVTIEDKRFFSHSGIDIIAKIRALWHNTYY